MFAIVGGALIGGAAALLFFTHGRTAGISGVVGSLLPPVARELGWRAAFLGGLLAAGVVAAAVAPERIGAASSSTPVLILAGLLVGFGSRLGSGCTSGHGVCGVSRLAPRSILAVATFTATGAITVWITGGVA